MRTLNYWKLLFVGLLVSGCAASGPAKTAANDLKQWRAVMQVYADAYDSMMGQPSPVFQVVVAPMIEYPIGTPLRVGTGSVIVDSCRIGVKSIQRLHVNAWPAVSSDTSFNTKVAIPERLAKALSAIAKADTTFKFGTKGDVEFKDQSAYLISEEVIKEQLLHNPACGNVLKGDKIDLVRGYIKARAVASNVKSSDASLSLSASGDKALDISYNSNGGWRVEDKDAQPYFLIKSTLTISSKLEKVTIGDDSSVVLMSADGDHDQDVIAQAAEKEKQDALAKLAKKQGLPPLEKGERYRMTYDITFGR